MTFLDQVLRWILYPVFTYAGDGAFKKHVKWWEGNFIVVSEA